MLPGVRGEVAALADDPDAPDRAARIDALAAIPEQIVRFLAERLGGRRPDHEPMLEVLVTRHYREFDLHDLRVLDVAGRPFVTADYVLDGPADPAGLHRRRPSTSSPTRTARWPPRSPSRWRPAPGRGGRRPLPVLAGAARRPEDGRDGAGRAARCAAVRLRRTPDRGGRLPRRRRRRSTTSPSVPWPATGHGDRGRRLVRGIHPMVGRRLQPVAAAGLHRHASRRARGRAALPLRGAGQPGRQAAGRARAGAGARRRPRRRRHRHRAAARGAGRGELPRGDPPGPHRSAARPGPSST